MAFGKKKNLNIGTHEKSDVAKKYGLRISNPHGYFPEDVDKLILKLESQIETLEKETHQLEERLTIALDEKRMIDSEYKKMKMQMSLMEVPDTTTEEDFSMFGRLQNINEDVGNMPEKLPEIVESRIPLAILEDDGKDESVFDSLVSQSVNKPKKKNITIKEDNSSNKFKANIFNDDGTLDIL